MKYEVSGPFKCNAAPYGKIVMRWESWYVIRGDRVREIRRFYDQQDYVINRTYPIKRFSSLARAVAWAKRSLQPKSKLTRFFCL